MSKKSFALYLSIILFLIVFVFIKQKYITHKNKKLAISFYSSWNAEGKPVHAIQLHKTDVERSWKMTLLPESDNTYVSYVPKSIQRSLSITTPITIHFGTKKIAGKIVEVGTVIHRETGMYPVKIYCPETPQDQKAKWLAELAVDGMQNAIVCPYDVIHIENNQPFVWIIREGKAHKQLVTLGERYSQGVVVKEIEEKDLLITRGSANLKENDIVRINGEN